MNSPPDTEFAFEALLHYLQQRHNFDFTGYKRSSLMRRVQHRMRMLPVTCYSNYIDYLEQHSEEPIHLFNTIEINVTKFFRDALVWGDVSAQIIPQIIESQPLDKRIRIWSAGCASGEETYTLAMILAEALGVEQFCSRVQIYGSDIDKEAISQARRGIYLSKDVLGIPDQFLERYFEQVGDQYVFRRDLRRSILFFQHNLIEDAPMSKIDLLVCRNVLIYLNAETQVRVLVRFHFGLKGGGFLCLGSTEIIPNELSTLFEKVDLRQRIFTKLPNVGLSPRLLVKALKRPRLHKAEEIEGTSA